MSDGGREMKRGEERRGEKIRSKEREISYPIWQLHARKGLPPRDG